MPAEPMHKAVLVTGGAGYIGSHTCVELIAAGYRVLVVDDLSNGSTVALSRASEITGRPIAFVEGDLRDRAMLDRVLSEHQVDAVVHFAGVKAVGESVRSPLRYFDCNVAGTVALLDAMQRHGVKRLIFSSSATVYGTPERLPVPEGARLHASNPYGRTKLMVEDMLRDICRADDEWAVLMLRYFNPVGAHESGRIGESPKGMPNNLMPLIASVAIGERPHLVIHGDDYPTPDGTGVRDYVHVMDLAAGHRCAVDKLRPGTCMTVNLGTGRGYSVLELVRAFEQVTGRTLPTVIGPRRPGDVAACYADASLAQEYLSWTARRGLAQMCRDAWRWQTMNPRGYESEEVV